MTDYRIIIDVVLAIALIVVASIGLGLAYHDRHATLMPASRCLDAMSR